jgi:hypothetical protein
LALLLIAVSVVQKNNYNHPHCFLQVRQLFEELVVPFVLSHERVAAVLLGKGWQGVSAEDARDKLWQVCAVV